MAEGDKKNDKIEIVKLIGEQFERHDFKQNAIIGAVNRDTDLVRAKLEESTLAVLAGLKKLDVALDVTPIVTALIGDTPEDETSLSFNIGKWLGDISTQIKALTEKVAPSQPPPVFDPFNPVRVEPEAGFIVIGDFKKMQITDSQQFVITFPSDVKDKKGFPAKVQDGSVTITVGNDTATVEPNPNDAANPFSALVKGSRPGADDGSEVTAVVISADADLGEGVKTISKAVELMVTAGEATGFGEPTVGAVEEQA